MRSRLRSRAFASILTAFTATLVVLSSQGRAAAASITVIPGAFALVEGNVAETATLGVAIQRYQQVFGVSLLGGLSPGEALTGITFRLDASSGALPAQTVPNYEIRLSQSTHQPGALSLTFADNRGADEVIVRSGPLVIDAGAFPAGATPNPFGAFIPFTFPYTFIGGPLLVEIAHTGFPSGGRLVDAHSGVTGAHAIFGNGFSATTANSSSAPNAAIIMAFQVQAVPEPASLTLLVLGGLALAAARRVTQSTRTSTSSGSRGGPFMR